MATDKAGSEVMGPKNSEPWQTLLRGKKEDNGIHPGSAPLMALLDDLANGMSPTRRDECLFEFQLDRQRLALLPR